MLSLLLFLMLNMHGCVPTLLLRPHNDSACLLPLLLPYVTTDLKLFRFLIGKNS